MIRRVVLRIVKVSDAPFLARWFNDRENVQFMSTVVRGKKHTPSAIKTDIEQSDRSFERLFMAYLQGKKEPIGHAGIDDLDLMDKRGEIFFLIGDKTEQGKGYGLEIVKALVGHGFQKLRLNSLFATATITNRASQRVLEKVGFRQIGIRREYNYIGGKFVDEVLYDLTRKDYARMRVHS